MKHRSAAGLAGLVLTLLLAAPAVAGPTVTVRIEGAAGTLLERPRVALPDPAPPVAGCGAHTAGAAIDVATAGNWDRQMFTETILCEKHAFEASDYWVPFRRWVPGGFSPRAPMLPRRCSRRGRGT